MLDGEKIESFEKELGFLLEAIARKLIVESPFWFDGVVGLTVKPRKKRQMIFSGKMWTAKDSCQQWLEDFEATVTDKRMTKQGIHIKIRLAEEVKEGDILEIL